MNDNYPPGVSDYDIEENFGDAPMSYCLICNEEHYGEDSYCEKCKATR